MLSIAFSISFCHSIISACSEPKRNPSSGTKKGWTWLTDHGHQQLLRAFFIANIADISHEAFAAAAERGRTLFEKVKLPRSWRPFWPISLGIDNGGQVDFGGFFDVLQMQRAHTVRRVERSINIWPEDGAAAQEGRVQHDGSAVKVSQGPREIKDAEQISVHGFMDVVGETACQDEGASGPDVGVQLRVESPQTWLCDPVVHGNGHLRRVREENFAGFLHCGARHRRVPGLDSRSEIAVLLVEGRSY